MECTAFYYLYSADLKSRWVTSPSLLFCREAEFSAFTGLSTYGQRVVAQSPRVKLC